VNQIIEPKDGLLVVGVVVARDSLAMSGQHKVFVITVVRSGDHGRGSSHKCATAYWHAVSANNAVSDATDV